MYKPHQGNGSSGWKGGNKFGDKKPWKRDFDNKGPRPMMYRATCTECGEACEVPFKPLGGRPVFCSHCFKKDEDGGAQKFGGRNDRPRFENNHFSNETPKHSDPYKEQFKLLNVKLDSILKALTTNAQAAQAASLNHGHESIEAEPVKKAAKKKTASKKKAGVEEE